jgi:hypothetical protein
MTENISIDAMHQYLISMCEKAFEKQIENFKIEVHCPEIRRLYILHNNVEMFEWIEKVHLWLSETFESDSYLAFPMENAFGKYKNCSNSVFFKNASDAIIFKITWI